MPPCKGHKKSRKGCLACKRRRVKCDEGHPRCANCTRRGERENCVYANNPETVVADDHNLVTTETVLETIDSRAPSVMGQCICGRLHAYPTCSPISVEFPGALPVCFLFNLLPAPSATLLIPKPQLSRGGGVNEAYDHGDLSLIDLTLLHHFTVYTAKAMTASAQNDVLKAWSEVVPKIGQSYPFVMHAILAAAAAHVYTEESMPVGEHHYGKAMEGITKELEGDGIRRINEDNCHALFLAINLLNLCTLSASRCRYRFDKSNSSQNDHGQKPLLRRLDITWTTFTRCSFGFLDKSWKWIINGPIASIILPYPPTPKYMPTLSTRTEAMLTELLRLCGDGLLDGAADELSDVQTATAYFAAIWNLRKIWVVLEDYVGYASGSGSNSNGDVFLCARYDEVSRRRTLPMEKAAALYSAIFQFVLRTPARFWECLDKKKPRALVIYAYFVACFEALNFGCDSSLDSTHNPWSHFDQSGSTAATWWILGRAKHDLRCVEDELRVLGVEEIWRDWVAGAWRIWDGLRKGWWFDWSDAASCALTVTRYIGAEFEHGQYGSVEVQHDDTSSNFVPAHTATQPLDSFDYTMNYSLQHFHEHWISGLLGADSSTMNAFISSEPICSEETSVSRVDSNLPMCAS